MNPFRTGAVRERSSRILAEAGGLSGITFVTVALKDLGFGFLKRRAYGDCLQKAKEQITAATMTFEKRHHFYR